MYDVPQLRCVESVETYAASNPATVGGTGPDANDVVPKNKMIVECAAELTADVDAVTLQLQFGNLMSRAYPELVSRHNQLALIEHARFAERNLLSQISAGSTAVTSAFKVGTARDFLLAIAKAGAAYRNRHRVARTTPLRVIAPEWVLDAMREDLTQQLPGLDVPFFGEAVLFLDSEKIEIIRLQALGRLAPSALPARLRHTPLIAAQGSGDLLRHLVLDSKDVVERAIIALGPDMIAGRRIDQLRSDAHLIAIGLLGEYIGRIYDQVKGRPLYLVQERLNADDPEPVRPGAGPGATVRDGAAVR